MTTDDAGIDKQKLLDEIVGGGAPPPDVSDPAPAEKRGSAPPGTFNPSPAGPGSWLAEEPAAEAAPSLPTASPPSREVRSEPAPVHRGRPAPPVPFRAHRREIAAIVLLFVGVVWLAVGVAIMRVAPFVVGSAFLTFGLALQARETRP